MKLEKRKAEEKIAESKQKNFNLFCSLFCFAFEINVRGVYISYLMFLFLRRLLID